jgi:DNA-binding protein HU-beta
MQKKDLLTIIEETANLTLKQAEDALKATFVTIQQVMAAQDAVAIPGFGRFSTKLRAERQGRNPSTGKSMTIPKATVPYFKAATELKEKVNNYNLEEK